MENNLSELRSYLKEELKKRNRLNSRYSKRAFARDLGLSPTCLNDFLSAKRSLSFKNIDAVFNYFGKKSVICCSWCEKPKKEAKTLIGGPRRQFICSDCVKICIEILEKKKPMPKEVR